MYVDGTSGINKADDAVPPGQKHTYVWIILPEYGPTAADPSCITWNVHSHNSAEEEVMTGAIAIMITCKPGTLDENGNRKDKFRVFPLFFMIFDENFSVYRDENIETYIPNRTPGAIEANFTIFQHANRKFSINGYIYGNLPGLEVCQGETVYLHLTVLGNDEDVHSINLQGHNLMVYHHSVATIGLYPGTSLTAIVDADNPGKWILSSQSVIYIEAGMEAIFTVKNCGDSVRYKPSKPKKIRRYYIAANEEWWEYAPANGYDRVSNIPLSEHPSASASFGVSNGNDCKLNGRYKKALFRGYTDKTFRYQVKLDPHFGFLGPPIKSEVGDVVKVLFYNNASRTYSLQAFRFSIAENESGQVFKGGSDVSVPPQGRREYTWRAPASAGPSNYDSDCVLGRYFSAVDPVADTYSGLTGPLVICRPFSLNSRGKKSFTDHEFYLSFSDVTEPLSHYFRESLQEACPNANLEQLMANETFVRANTMRSLNGRVYGNLDGLVMSQGDRVTWYMMSVGSGVEDVHTPHFFGNTFIINRATKDSYPLIPNTFITADMVPDNIGIWRIEDQTTIYTSAATQMEFLYQVLKNRLSSNNPNYYWARKTRVYYIAAVEREWDYAPVNRHIITGEPLSENKVSQLYYNNIPEKNMIGHKYKKALFREFTDATFKTEKIREFNDEHLGMLGPFIEAEVGERIKVVFKNMASHNYSILPHGLFYNKTNEGDFYNDNITARDKPGSIVRPGKTYTYNWFVPERAGPGPDNFNCVNWVYVSHVDYGLDLNDGLMGPLVICNPGILKENGRRGDVDREWAILYCILNEVKTHYTDENIRTYLHKKPSDEIRNDLTFFASNAMLNINGYIFGNVPNLTMVKGETVAINLMALGDTTIHTAHFHGNTFLHRLSGIHRHDAMAVLPGDFQMVELYGYNVGTWLSHCHVNNHSENGMEMVYNVVES